MYCLNLASPHDWMGSLNTVFEMIGVMVMVHGSCFMVEVVSPLWCCASSMWSGLKS